MIFIFTDITAREHKVSWEDSSLSFEHLASIVVNHKVYDCQHGVDRHMNAKKGNQAVGLFYKQLLLFMMVIIIVIIIIVTVIIVIVRDIVIVIVIVDVVVMVIIYLFPISFC